MKAWPALIAGILFGLGLTLSGMSDPAKVLGFLNIAGDWVPDLIFVMGGAVVVTLIFTPLVVKRARPLLADSFSLPTTKTLDKRLVSGAVLFGVGWGLSGYCPGPAVVSLLYGYESTIVFCLAMLAGMSIEGRVSKRLG
ncbi:MAG: YeeE/YedE family protein [Halieaceae bacterium]